MNRIDRLTAILIQLQSKRIVKAREIAERFSISLRTVYRDIRALEDAGVPIGARAGEGYFIVDGYHLPPVIFTKDEAGSLLMGGKLIDMFSDLSVKAHFESSLYKIKSVLNSGDKEYLERLNSYIEVLKSPVLMRDGFPNNLLSSIQSYLGRKKIIRIDYHSGYKDETTTRDIEPLGLCFYATKWHLIAYCRLRNDYRDFRVDRIKNVSETDRYFDVDRHDSLEKLIEKLIRMSDFKPAVVRFNKAAARVIREVKFFYGFAEEREVEDQVEMNFLITSYPYFAKWLLGFIDEVDVRAPAELKNLMKNYASKLFEHYGKQPQESDFQIN